MRELLRLRPSLLSAGAALFLIVGAMATGVLGAWLPPSCLAPSLRDSRALRTLQLGIDGCTHDLIVEPELTCQLWKNSAARQPPDELRIALRSRPGAEVVLEDEDGGVWPFRGTRLGRPATIGALGDGLIVQKLRSDVRSLLLTARDPGTGELVGRARLRLRRVEMSELDREVLYRAVDYTDTAARKDILARLEAALSRTVAPDERTGLLLHLVTLRDAYLGADRKARAQALDEPAKELRTRLQETLVLARQTHRVRTEARLLSMLALLTMDEPSERQRLSDELTRSVATLDILPVEQSYLYYLLGELAHAQKDLRQEHAHLAAALRAAEWIGDQEAIARRKARLLRVRGSEGDDIDDELAAQEQQARQSSDACEGTRQLLNTGWAELLRWELTWGAGRDPQPLFEEVVRRSRGQGAVCPDASRAQNALASLARRLSLPPPSHDADRDVPGAWKDWREQTAKLIAEARAMAESGPLERRLGLDLLFAEARLALGTGDAETAFKRFSSLIMLTARDSVLEDRWEAVCGAASAQSLLGQDVDRARPRRLAEKQRLLEQCSSLLDELVGNVWLAAQAPALDQRDHALGRVLAMLRAGDNRALLPSILTTLRRASRRALAPYRWPLPPDADPRTVGELGQDYRAQRAAFEDWLEKTWPQQIPQRDTPAGRQQRIEKRRALLNEFDSAFVALRQQTPSAVWRQLPALPDRDLVVICHSEGQNVLCITALGSELHSHVLSPQSRGNKSLISDELLGPWRGRLPGSTSGADAAIKRVRVIAHGWLRDVDVADWPLDGQPLIARLPIVHSLDIVPVAQSPSEGAVFAIHPESDLGGAEDTVAMLEKNLAAAPWKKRYFSVDIGGPGRIQLGPVDLDREPIFGRLFPMQSGARTFVALGHFRPALCSGDPPPFDGGRARDSAWLTSFCLPSFNAIWPSDILLAPRVPEIVLLLGCASGKTDSASTTAVSMASAYVLRGSRAVLSTTRDITQPLARQMLCHLSREPDFGSPRFDLAAAVQRAQKALIDRVPCPGGAPVDSLPRDGWTAFRVSEP